MFQGTRGGRRRAPGGARGGGRSRKMKKKKRKNEKNEKMEKTEKKREKNGREPLTTHRQSRVGTVIFVIGQYS